MLVIKRILILTLLLTVASVSYATEIDKRGLSINYISAMGDKTSSPQYLEGMSLVGFSDVSWLPSVCQADGVYIRHNQSAMLSIALKAFELNKTVNVLVDSARVRDGYCELSYLLMLK